MEGQSKITIDSTICRDAHLPGILSIAKKIRSLSDAQGSALVAIDGRAAAGKSTLAHLLKAQLACNVFHMDDFFLPQTMKTAERLHTPGGNVHYERFLSDVLIPLGAGKPFAYRPYSCKTQSPEAPVQVVPAAINLVEGAYALHPALSDRYDYKIFVDIPYETQIARILSRNGAEALRRFREEWIPLEEQYFDAFAIRGQCDLVVSMGS